MKKPIVIFSISILLFNLLLIVPYPLSSQVSALRYDMNTNLSNTDASFLSLNNLESIGHVVEIAGDVNDDGYDDILISTPYNSEAGPWAGKTYLIFGKSSGWSKGVNLSKANASFLGEYSWDFSGDQVAGAGDVNGDGLDDILIGAEKNDEGGTDAGQVYLIFGKQTGWRMDNVLSISDASFIGENASEGVGNKYGKTFAGVGDVNGDSYDDILIGTGGNDEGGENAGQVYLIFGKRSGWAMDINLSSADASFIGEYAKDKAGLVAGAGDVNGDGYDDFLIGSAGNDEGGKNSTQTYLIFGKRSGWSIDTNISNADASFIGEIAYDYNWLTVAGAGDINSDGFDDILIGNRGVKKAGQVYLILGKNKGWTMDTNLSSADASFIGESRGDYAGISIAGAGDVNGDGNDDILIGAYLNDEVHEQAGQAYLIFPELNLGPKVVYSIEAYSESNCINEISAADISETVYIELSAKDENTTRIDRAGVNVTGTSGSSNMITLYLIETGLNTGKYRGYFKISDKTHHSQRLINASIGDNITISSITNPAKSKTIQVNEPILIKPLYNNTIAIEDEYYAMHFLSIGYNDVSFWRFNSNARWLSWNVTTQNISGTPDNGDVGTCWVRLNISDLKGNYYEHYSTITVRNTVPSILTENVQEAFEDELYYVDYDSDDEGLGGAYWHLETDASWLSLDSASGVLSGTPKNDDVGPYSIKITILDGHGFKNWTEFILTVIDTNDAPMIITENITTVLEDDFYSVDYKALDIDGDKIFKWSLETNASWLSIDNASGLLSGTPANDDVGISYVNVTVSDLRDGTNSQNFTLEVINVNDNPSWIDVPKDIEIDEGRKYIFDVNAIDVDVGDVLSFDIESKPETDIIIDPETGFIQWKASIKDLEASYILKVIVSVTDGEVSIFHYFDITVISNPIPTVLLISPLNNILVSSIGIEFKWSGHDAKDRPLTYDVYLSKNHLSISNLLESAIIIPNTDQTSFSAENLEVGGIYYWTVIPFNGFSYGKCIDEFFVFAVNTPPTISAVPNLKASVGTKFEYELKVNDINREDSGKLVYSLNLAPAGLSIKSSSGVITWTPSEDQIGNHMVKARVSDGKDVTTTQFEIEVIKSARTSESTSVNQLLVFGVIIVIVVIILSFIAFIKFKRRKKRIIPEVEYIPPHQKKDMFSVGVSARPRTLSAPMVIIDQVSSPGQQPQMPPTPAPGQTLSILKPTAIQPLLPPAPGDKPIQEPTLVPTPVPTLAPTPAPAPVPVMEPQPTVAAEYNVKPDFGIPGGLKPVQKDVVEHDVVSERVVEKIDTDSATADLRAAPVVKPTEESTVVHEGDTSIWRPDIRGKVAENKEVLEQLEKLIELKAKGGLTDAEFELKKRELFR